MKNNDGRIIAAPFSNFEFTGAYARRNQPLSSVMPVNSGFGYVVVLTDAYLRNSNSDIPVGGFEQLCAAFNEHLAMNALVSARKSGSLTEGKKFLPSAIVDFLVLVGGPTIYIRFEDEGELQCHTIAPSLLKTDIIASQGVHDREFELCDTYGLWYLRFRDDDAVMFFSAKVDLIDELTTKFPDNCLVVPPDFIYSS